MALLVPLLVSTVTGLVTVSPTGRPTLRRPCNVQPGRHSQLRAIAGSKVRVRLRRPLGIMFEETNPGKAEGVVVADLVEDGNAWKDGRVFVGDRLAKVSAVILGGESALVTVGGGKQYTNWERELVPCTKMDFDSIMAAIGLPSASNQGATLTSASHANLRSLPPALIAIGSNSGAWGYTDVALALEPQRSPSPSPLAASPHLSPTTLTRSSSSSRGLRPPCRGCCLRPLGNALTTTTTTRTGTSAAPASAASPRPLDQNRTNFEVGEHRGVQCRPGRRALVVWFSG